MQNNVLYGISLMVITTFMFSLFFKKIKLRAVLILIRLFLWKMLVAPTTKRLKNII